MKLSTNGKGSDMNMGSPKKICSMCLATVQNGSNVIYMRLKPMTIKISDFL